jgi:hypothetical protein
MNARLAFIALSILATHAPADAHRLDEYLQATLISIETERIDALLRLTPGVAVSSSVIAVIDTNTDNSISTAEQRAYAQRVLRELTVELDDEFLTLTLDAVEFPALDAEMKEGLGEIQIRFSAQLPPGGTRRTLAFKNYHQPSIGVYLVNCLVPRNRDVHIVAQHRNEQQSVYEIEYVQSVGKTARRR